MNAVTQVKQTSKTPLAVVNTAMQQDQQQYPASMDIKVQIHDGLACIAMFGRFDFQLWRSFRNSYAPLLDNASIKEISVEMSKVDYLDSSAMGMLLLLSERAKAANKTVTLLTTSSFVSQVLDIANFSKVFNINHIGILAGKPLSIRAN